MAESQLSTHCLTSHVIRRELVWMSGSDSTSVGSGWKDMTGYLAVRNTANCVELYNWSKSTWRQELGKIDCVCQIMRWCPSTLGLQKSILLVPESNCVIASSHNAPPLASSCQPCWWSWWWGMEYSAMMAFKCISLLSQWVLPGVPSITSEYRLQPNWPYVYTERDCDI